MNKKIKPILLVIALFNFCISCKKTNEAEPELLKVYDITDKVNGLGYADLMEIADKWLFAAKEGENPADDADGKYSGASYQPNTNITILAPNFGGTSNRTLSISASKPVYFPILGVVGWYFDNDPCDPTFGPATGQSVDAFFKPEIEAYLAATKTVTATLDGKPIVQDLTKYLSFTKAYDLEIPKKYQDPNCDNNGKKAHAISGGYSLLLKLPKGKHVLNYKGVVKGDPDFEAEVTWNLTVE